MKRVWEGEEGEKHLSGQKEHERKQGWEGIWRMAGTL